MSQFKIINGSQSKRLKDKNNLIRKDLQWGVEIFVLRARQDSI